LTHYLYVYVVIKLITIYNIRDFLKFIS